MIISTIQQYARATDNRRLLGILDRFKDFDPTTPDPTAARSRYHPSSPNHNAFHPMSRTITPSST